MDDEALRRGQEPAKPIAKRPFLARGTGKAGGIGQKQQDSKVETPTKQKKSKSTDPLARHKVGQGLLSKPTTERDYPKDSRGSTEENRYQLAYRPNIRAPNRTRDVVGQSRNYSSNLENDESIPKSSVTEDNLAK